MDYGAGALLIAIAMEHAHIQLTLLIGTMGGALAGVQQLEDARNLFGIGAYDIALGDAAYMVHFAGGLEEKN